MNENLVSVFAFGLLRQVADGSLNPDMFLRAFATAVKGSAFSDNDIRTDLWFGDAEYTEAEKLQLNTRWLYEKNVQGPPFMECILFNPTDSMISWKLHAPFADLYQTTPFQTSGGSCRDH